MPSSASSKDNEREVDWLDLLGVIEHDRELGTDSWPGESTVVRDLAVNAKEAREQAGSVEPGAGWDTDVIGPDHCSGPISGSVVDWLAQGLSPVTSAT
jgi:hypothetical protein